MLRVNAGGRELVLRWTHFQPPTTVQKLKKYAKGLEDLNAAPEDFPPPGSQLTVEDGDRNTLVVVDAFLHPNDRFDKEIGRKVSLTKALQKLFPSDGNKVVSTCGYYDEFLKKSTDNYMARRAIWEAYFARKKK